MLSTSAIEKSTSWSGSMWCSKSWQYLGKFIIPSRTVNCPTPPKPLCFLLNVSQLQQCKQVYILPHVSFGHWHLLGLDIAGSWTHLTSVLVSTDGVLHPTYVSLFYASLLSMGFFSCNTQLETMFQKLTREQFWLYTGPLIAPTSVTSVFFLSIKHRRNRTGWSLAVLHLGCPLLCLSFRLPDCWNLLIIILALVSPHPHLVSCSKLIIAASLFMEYLHLHTGWVGYVPRLHHLYV